MKEEQDVRKTKPVMKFIDRPYLCIGYPGFDLPLWLFRLGTGPLLFITNSNLRLFDL